MTAKIVTQNETLKNHFRISKRLTQMAATINYGILRLSERIRELESQGWQFDHTMIEVPTRYGRKVRVAEYVLIAQPKRSR